MNTSDWQLYCPVDCEADMQRYAPYLRLCAAARPAWPDQSGATQPPWWLQYEHQRLSLWRAGDRRGVCVAAEQVRRRAVRGSELARACGLTGGSQPVILDATAGWGVDALSLASLGAQVTAVERLPLMWALLQDLASCCAVPAMAIHCADVWQWLPQQAPGQFDVVYLDPMFPRRNKTAAPNKRLQYLAELAGEHAAPEPDLEALLQHCKVYARRRIVLKRRRNDPPLAVAPSWQIKGRTVRYDVLEPHRL